MTSGIIGEFNRSEFYGNEPVLTSEVLGPWQSRDKKVLLDLLPDGTVLGYFSEKGKTRFQQAVWDSDCFKFDNLVIEFKKISASDVERTFCGRFLGPGIFYTSDPDVALDPDIESTFDNLNQKAIKLDKNYRNTLRFDTKNGGYSFIDLKGIIKIFGPFIKVRPFKSGYSWVTWMHPLDSADDLGRFESYIDKGGIYYWNIDEDSKKKFSAKNYSSELEPFREGLKWGFRDKAHRVVIAPKFEWADHFSENIAVVRHAGMFGLIGKTGRFVIQPKYFAARRCSQGMIPVVDRTGLWTYISKDGSIAFDKRFYSAQPFSDGLAAVYGPVKSDPFETPEIKASKILVIAQSYHYLHGRNYEKH
ncbi:MAG: WG repeat-containing protein [Cyanobacteria bacterium TGS_CYA1]|nr:WG repeat-containing protein [Cyanobacteria bacterium TGS_CYA1]